MRTSEGVKAEGLLEACSPDPGGKHKDLQGPFSFVQDTSFSNDNLAMPQGPENY